MECAVEIGEFFLSLAMGVRLINDLCPARYAGKWAAATYHLTVGGEIRLHFIPGLSAAVSQPEPGDHLVEDEQDIVVFAQFLHALERFGLGRDDALN